MLTAADLFLKQSEKMTDFTDSGGRITDNDVEDNTLNNIFPLIASGDRIKGRVWMNKIYAAVRSDDDDMLYSARAMLTELPADPNVSIALFTLKDWYDTKFDAQKYIEASLSPTTSTGIYIADLHEAGQDFMYLFVRVEEPQPNVGSKYYISMEDADQNKIAGEFFQINNLTPEGKVTFKDPNDPEKPMICNRYTVSITDPLENDYLPNVKWDGKTYTMTTSFPLSVIKNTRVNLTLKIYGITKTTKLCLPGVLKIPVRDTKIRISPSIFYRVRREQKIKQIPYPYVSNDGKFILVKSYDEENPIPPVIPPIKKKFCKKPSQIFPVTFKEFVARFSDYPNFEFIRNTCYTMPTRYSDTMAFWNGIVTASYGTFAKYGSYYKACIGEVCKLPSEIFPNNYEDFVTDFEDEPDFEKIKNTCYTISASSRYTDTSACWLDISTEFGVMALNPTTKSYECCYEEELQVQSFTGVNPDFPAPNMNIINTIKVSYYDKYDKRVCSLTNSEFADELKYANYSGIVTDTYPDSAVVGNIIVDVSSLYVPTETRNFIIEYDIFDNTDTRRFVTYSIFYIENVPVDYNALQISGTTEEDAVLSCTCNEDGFVRGDAAGSINIMSGLVSIKWNSPVRDITIITESFQPLPLPKAISGIEAKALPLDGYLPIGKAGDSCAIHYTQEYECDDPLVAATEIDLGETDLARIRIYDSNGKRVTDTLFTSNLKTGIVTFIDEEHGFNTKITEGSYLQPLIIKYTVMEEFLITALHNTDELGSLVKTKELENPLSADTLVQLPAQHLTSINLYDADRVLVDTEDGLYIPNLTTGNVLFCSVADGFATKIANYTQPLTVSYVYGQSGEIDISTQLKRLYPENSIFSVGMHIGDMVARVPVCFAQASWIDAWYDVRNGAPITAKYNDAAHPIVVTNKGAINERWAIIFTSATAFKCIGEHLGQLSQTGTVNDDYAPINEYTSEPLFTISKLGWSYDWATGNVLRFNTLSTDFPIWVLRCLQGGSTYESQDSTAIEFLGDV